LGGDKGELLSTPYSAGFCLRIPGGGGGSRGEVLRTDSVAERGELKSDEGEVAVWACGGGEGGGGTVVFSWCNDGREARPCFLVVTVVAMLAVSISSCTG